MSLRWVLTIVSVSALTLGVIDVTAKPRPEPQVLPPRLALAIDAPKRSAVPLKSALSHTPATNTGMLPKRASNACPPDMVDVSGEYCSQPEEVCDDYISEKRDRCRHYRSPTQCVGRPEPKHFCIDQYEYPDRAGQLPIVAYSWDNARDICATEGKRLCSAEEWSMACEGPKWKPYPYGYRRDDTACNIDKPYIMPDNDAFENPRTRAAEIARVRQSEPSGSRPRCRSEFGVYDMTGNVDEWVLNDAGSRTEPPYQSGLKGGWWGPVRDRCRPMTTDHNEWHSGYQIGFRCCKDVAVESTPIVSQNSEKRSRVSLPNR